MKSAGTLVGGYIWMSAFRNGAANSRALHAACIAVLLIAGFVAGCGGYSSGNGTGSGGGGGISAAITNPVTTLQTGAMYTFTATTPSSNGYTSGITWTIMPTTGAGTLSNATNNGFSSSVTYQAPATLPSPNSVTITATPSDTRVRPATNTFTLTAAPSSMSMLAGQFAFEVAGLEATGESFTAAGTLIADGAGKITGGSLDFNRNRAPSIRANSLTGTYSLDATRQGRISLSTIPGAGRSLTLSFVLASDQQSATLTDTNDASMSGRLIHQDPTAFNLARISSDFVFKLEANTSNRIATIGKLTIGANSAISGMVDQSQAGDDPILESASAAGRLTAAPDTNGRGTFTLATPSGNSTFVFYVATDSRLMLLETDSGTAAHSRQAGLAERQALPFSAATANSSGQIEGSGFDAQPSSFGPVSVQGSLAVQNLSHATLSWDARSVGANVSIDGLRSDLVTFDPATGRGTIRIANGFANNFADSVVFYLAGPGQGFFLDTTAGRFNRAIAGDLESAAAK